MTKNKEKPQLIVNFASKKSMKLFLTLLTAGPLGYYSAYGIEHAEEYTKDKPVINVSFSEYDNEKE